MTDEQNWKNAPGPNYCTNVDKLYPYSELPHLGEFRLVRIPLTLNDYVDHVDYWGEGRVAVGDEIWGFSDCYNVNFTYQLVTSSNSTDYNKKIPNRIPVDDDCVTSAYIKDNSVLLVTVMESEYFSSSCAKDITRIVNKEMGIVVTYGYDFSSQSITNLSELLKDKGIYHCPNYKLPDMLEEVTSKKRITFLNTTLIKTELHRLIKKKDYTNAVSLSKNLNNKVNGDIIEMVIHKILTGGAADYNILMTYGNMLWRNGGKDVVRNNFPSFFKLLLEQNVKIVNKEYNQALKLNEEQVESGDRIVLGGHDQNNRDGWKFTSIDINDGVIFTLYDIDSNMYLKSTIEDNNEVIKTYASLNNDTDEHKYILEPHMKEGKLCCHIISYQYRQGLKLAENADKNGDRQVLGHNGAYKNENECEWLICEHTTRF